jgi:hypothetical protein
MEKLKISAIALGCKLVRRKESSHCCDLGELSMIDIPGNHRDSSEEV